MQNKITVSILGAGNIAGGFDEKKLDEKSGIFSHAGAYKKSGKFILKNIFDVDTKRVKEFAKYWDVQNIVKSENEIINQYQDIISICSPDRFHFQTLKNIILNKSCKTIFVEKPLGLTLDEVNEIYKLSLKNGINIVVNFQRHFDDSYNTLDITNSKVLSVNCYYIKGLNHIGITMLDTLVMILGYPKSVQSYNKIYNMEVKDFTYEFILFYENFNVTVKSIDEEEKYNYHLFDIDILTDKGRNIFTDNGNTLLNYDLTEYSYSGVKVLNNQPKKIKTQYDNSMLKSVEYLYDITYNNKVHHTNTVASSCNNHQLLDRIVESYKKEKKIFLKETLWKK
jgi:predicted dehydrogenase